MLEFLEKDSHILLVDNANIELGSNVKISDVKLDVCPLADVLGVGGGIYDAIIFPTMPTPELIEKVIEKIYWGGYIIILGIKDAVEEAGYEVIDGSLEPLVLRRPPLPDRWSKECFLFLKGGNVWNPKTKEMHQRYRDRFGVIDAKWDGAVVIEYGCGRGELTRLIATAGAKKVYAIDNSVAAIMMTRNFCGDLDNVVTICTDALTWLAPALADVIVAQDFVEHFYEADLISLFRRWRDNLKDGGLVHVLTPRGGDAVRNHKWAPTPSALRDLMNKAGFECKRTVTPDDSRKFFAEFFLPKEFILPEKEKGANHG